MTNYIFEIVPADLLRVNVAFLEDGYLILRLVDIGDVPKEYHKHTLERFREAIKEMGFIIAASKTSRIYRVIPDTPVKYLDVLSKYEPPSFLALLSNPNVILQEMLEAIKERRDTHE